MDKRELTQEEIDFVSQRTAAYITATIEAYNKELANADKSQEKAALEATAAISALTAITISIIGSIVKEKDDVCAVMTDHIEHLDKVLIEYEESTQNNYSATQEDANLGSLEVYK